ncbi:unnamed protein product [Arabis nemorensis]|uniref:Transposase MuDR plant domain-containing protein n=1 Tax=Arabis nemorensis TaxID=586526 RepID=A0A565CNX1_9BRAS|nr:unnamed protein product [Arabis nemorensis]
MYVGGSHQFIEARPSQFFTELQNQLPVSLYGQRISYKPPFDEIEDRRVLTNSNGSFKKMCDTTHWTKAIDIFVVGDIERYENESVENERDETHMDGIERDENERVQNERYETERVENERVQNVRVEHQFAEEARVERNVADFIDEEIDEYATPVCSDDDQDHDKKLDYFTYKKGSGELKLEQAFYSLDAFKKAILEYVLKHGWNVKYTRWDKDISERLKSSKRSMTHNLQSSETTALSYYDSAEEVNAVSMTVILTVLAQNGSEEGPVLFIRMVEGVDIDAHVASAVLGLSFVDTSLGLDKLARCKKVHGTEHYDSLPIKLDCFVWHALVGACNFHGDTEMGKFAAEKLSHLAPDSSATYTLKERAEEN